MLGSSATTLRDLAQVGPACGREAFAHRPMYRIRLRLRRSDRLLEHAKGVSCPHTEDGLVWSGRHDVVSEQEFDRQQVLEQTQGSVGLAYGQRRGGA